MSNTSPPDPLTMLTQAVHHEQLAAQRLAMVLDHAVSFDLMRHLTTEVLIALDTWRVASAELFVYLSEPALKAMEAGPTEDQQPALVPEMMEYHADGSVTLTFLVED